MSTALSANLCNKNNPIPFDMREQLANFFFRFARCTASILKKWIYNHYE